MKFGLFTSIGGMTWSALQWQHIEATGWDAACVADHFMPNVPDPVQETLECWTALAGLALTTKRMRIGTLVTGNTYRHPALVAKMAANVDIMSGGRLICGMGAGWQKNEHVAYGMPFYTVGERLNRLEEACQILRRLWTEHKTTLQGRFYQLQEAPLYPKAVQQPHPELLIGGGGEKRTLQIAAKYADHWNCWAGPETMQRKIQILEAHCAAVGRDPFGGIMLYGAAVFFVIALLAAIFGFGGLAASAAGVAKILFFVFLILALLSFIFGRRVPT